MRGDVVPAIVKRLVVDGEGSSVKDTGNRPSNVDANVEDGDLSGTDTRDASPLNPELGLVTVPA